MIPNSIQRFVEQQETMPLKELLGGHVDPPTIPYTEYWHRAIAAMLLSGRVKPKVDGFPNMTDVMRLCKEANFNPYLFERTGEFLKNAGVVAVSRPDNSYRPGEFANAFWERDITGLQMASRRAFLEFVGFFTGLQPWRPQRALQSKLDDFLTLFAFVFDGLALRWNQIGEILFQFSKVSAKDLIRLGREIGTKFSDSDAGSWNHWLDKKNGQQAFSMALTMCDWVYVDDSDKPQWCYLNDSARMMLGLEEVPALSAPVTDFHALSNFSILAGSDLSPEKIVPLFRYCKVHRIDRVFEFHLDKRHLTEMPSKTSAEEELREVLAELEPLPVTIASFLKGSRSPRTGEIQIRFCSAIVKPENAEVLNAIREHGKLKNYLEPGAPEGCLLIKPRADPYNFVRRSAELGFKVKVSE